MQASPTHVLIAANPKSGASSGRSKVCELRDALQSAGSAVEICESLELLTSRSHQLHASGQLQAVVSAGGDGTASAVVNRIPLGVPIVILPLGTENLLAKHLGLTGDVGLALEAVRSGKILRLDVGSAGGQLFLIMLGCGFDAEVVQHLHSARSGHINRWTYSKPILRAVRNYAYPQIDVTCDPPAGSDKELRFSTAWLFAFNLPRYAANLDFCPQASGSDGLLDICSFARGGNLRGFGYLFSLWLGRHQRLRDFRHLTTKRFHLSSQGSVPYQIDGDPGGMLPGPDQEPLKVEVLPERLTLLVPNCCH
jgi:diacylglycerol kinase family enzyme